MPARPEPMPLIFRFRSVTTSGQVLVVLVTLTTMPFVPDTSTDANIPPPSMVIGLVMVTAPYGPGSITLISPQSAVFEIAPANVLHGAVRLQGLASSPTPETHVRVA